MEIKQIDIQWKNDYSVFVKPEYLKYVNNEYIVLGGFQNKELKFIIGGVVHKKWIFKHIKFLGSTVYADEKMTVEDEKKFLDSIVKYAIQNGFDFIVQPQANAVFNICPEGSISTEFGTYIVDLNLSEDEIWKNIHSKHKNVIRKSIKNNVVIKDDIDCIEDAHFLLKEAMKRSDQSFMSLDEFKVYINSFGDNIKIFTAYYDNEPQGCSIMPFSNYSAYYMYGGSIRTPFTGAVNLLHFEAMKYFKTLNVKYYDFVGGRVSPEKGSRLEGIQRFKSRFGGEFKKGYLWKYNLKPFKTFLYQKLHSMKYGKHTDIIDQENSKKTT